MHTKASLWSLTMLWKLFTYDEVVSLVYFEENINGIIFWKVQSIFQCVCLLQGYSRRVITGTLSGRKFSRRKIFDHHTRYFDDYNKTGWLGFAKNGYHRLKECENTTDSLLDHVWGCVSGSWQHCSNCTNASSIYRLHIYNSSSQLRFQGPRLAPKHRLCGSQQSLTRHLIFCVTDFVLQKTKCVNLLALKFFLCGSLTKS